MGRFPQQDHRGVSDQVEQHLVGRHTVLRGQRRQPDNPHLGQVRDSRGGRCPSRPGGRRYRCCGGTQEVAHFLVGGLGEVPIRPADREERRGSGGADHLIDDLSKFLASGLRRHRHGDDHPSRPVPA
jgi:hypothetical protein